MNLCSSSLYTLTSLHFTLLFFTLRCSIPNFTSYPSTSLYCYSLHHTPLHSTFTSLHFTLLFFTLRCSIPNFTSYPSTSLYCYSLHHTPLHSTFTSLYSSWSRRESKRTSKNTRESFSCSSNSSLSLTAQPTVMHHPSTQ